MEIFAAPAGFSVLEPNILLLAEREDLQLLRVRIFSEQTYRADPAVFIGLVIVDPLLCAGAAGVGGNVAAPFRRDHASPDHGDRIQEMEKLGYPFLFGRSFL